MYKYDVKKTLLTLPAELVNDFQSKYPRLQTVFIRRCILKAVKDRDFFESIYFGVKDKYSLLGQYRPEYQLQDD